MPFETVEIFNTSGLEKHEGYGGYIVPRFPKSARMTQTPRGRFVSLTGTGVEIRFLTEARLTRLALSTVKNADIYVYRGNFKAGEYTIPEGRITTLELENTPFVDHIDAKAYANASFNPSVFRVRVKGGTLILHDIETFGYETRPPKKEELPKYTWLAYGSSITHSWLDGYPFVAAEVLKVDIKNKGMGGSCFIEKETADYLASETFDFATLELGVNMRGTIETEEFEKRARYLVSQLQEKHAGKPIALITTFPNSGDFYLEKNVGSKHQREYNDVLRALAKEKGCILIEGADVLTDFCGLSQDLIHPTTYGHALMGTNLATKLKEHIPFLA